MLKIILNKSLVIFATVVVFLMTLNCIKAQYRSTDENVWLADTAVKKPDPWMWISGENDNTNEEWYPYHWNNDHWDLIGRQPETCNGCTRNGKDIYIDKDKLKIFVNDEEYIIKAMCYNPAPLGMQDMDPTEHWGGTGLCSPRLNPYGDFKSACYDSDFWDGSIMSDRDPPGPAGGWFRRLWLRDFPIMKEMGTNTIRIYNSNPATKEYTEKVLEGEIRNTDIVHATGKFHVPFLNAARNAGLMVIFPLLGDEGLLNNLPRARFEELLRAQIDEVGNHPSILMFTLGNELGLGEKIALRAKVNQYIDYARKYTKEKWDRFIPITNALVDLPDKYNELYGDLDVDVMSTNAGYRGLDFSDLFEGNTNNFTGLTALSKQYGKPIFISEIGWHQEDGEQTAALPGWFNQIWKDLLDNVENGAIGGAFFEYNDEPLKDDPEQQTMGVVRFEENEVSEIGTSTTTSSPYTTTGGFPGDGGDGSGGDGSGGDGSGGDGTAASANTLTSILISNIF